MARPPRTFSQPDFVRPPAATLRQERGGASGDSTLATTVGERSALGSAEAASDSRRRFRSVSALPIFTKVMIGNAAIVIVGAIVGTYVTAYTVQFRTTGSPLELVFFFAARACFSRSANDFGTFASFVFVTSAMFSRATGAP